VKHRELIYVVVQHLDPPGFYVELVNGNDDIVFVTSLFPSDVAAIVACQEYVRTYEQEL
jgi:hypothetical protein